MKIGIDVRLWNETGVGRYIRNLLTNLSRIDKQNEYVLFARTQDTKNFKFQISNFKFQIVPADFPWHSLAEQILFSKLINKEGEYRAGYGSGNLGNVT